MDERQSGAERIDADIEAELDRNIWSDTALFRGGFDSRRIAMRDRWSKRSKSHDRGKQNDSAKTSGDLAHDFPLRQDWRKAP